MPRYKQYEHLPWWLSCLDHHTLTPTEKETLNLDYFCKRHGTKLSHQAAANLLHRSRSWIVKCRRRLEVLGLRRTEPAKGSFKLGHPVEYPNEQAFFEQLERGRGSSRGVFKIPKYSGGLPPPMGGKPPLTIGTSAGNHDGEREFAASIAGGLNGFGSGVQHGQTGLKISP